MYLKLNNGIWQTITFNTFAGVILAKDYICKCIIHVQVQWAVLICGLDICRFDWTRIPNPAFWAQPEVSSSNVQEGLLMYRDAASASLHLRRPPRIFWTTAGSPQHGFHNMDFCIHGQRWPWNRSPVNTKGLLYKKKLVLHPNQLLKLVNSAELIFQKKIF